jgi:serine/threonine protein kinase/CRP-like cAMP-binding protein
MTDVFGRYQILQQVAHGGMAEILLARPLSGTIRVCAIKRILPQFSTDLQFVSMFIDEARITIGLNHDNVVRLYDFGQVDGVYFMAIEYVDGTDLAALLSTFATAGRGLPPIVAASIMADVARGLAHAHTLRDAAGRSLGVVHRDVSPQNVLLSSAGEVKITDFGIAAAKNKLTLTSPGVVLGKAAYMAPEQATGRGVDFACDLWALGVMLWESLVGDRLFAADNPVQTLQRVMHEVVPAPSSVQPEVPRALDDVVASLLQRDKAARPRATADVVRALDDVVAALATTSPLARHGVFGSAERAAFLSSVQWTDDTGPMRPRASAAPVPTSDESTTRRPESTEDTVLARLLERCAAEQDPWLLVDVGERAQAIGRADLARSAFRTAAAAFAFRGLLVQSLVAHAGARPLLTPDEAREDVLLLGDVTPGRRSELEELLRLFDGHGLSRCVSRQELPVPPLVPLLGALGPRELARVADVVGIRRVKKGDIVLREGERGNVLYAVGRGRLVVSCQPGEQNAAELPVELPGGIDELDFSGDATLDVRPLRVSAGALSQQHQDRIFIAGLADGDFFGEFSFLAERTRSATVEAVTDGLLLEIDRSDVENIAAVDPEFTAPLLAFYKERVVELMMAKSPVFSLLSPTDRRALLDEAAIIDVDHDALIVREGTRNDALFFIRRGEVEIFRRDKSGLTIFINKLGQGQFFGEIAALKGTPRTVSVRAIGPVSLFQIEGRLLHALVDREPRLRVMFDAMIARRAAEAKARVLEHDLLLVQT